MTPLAVSEVLLRAAEHIETHGWANGHDFTRNTAGDDQVCAGVAIHRLFQAGQIDNDTAREARRALLRYVGRPFEEYRLLNGVWDWNDSHKSPAPVIAALRECAAKMEEAERGE